MSSKINPKTKGAIFSTLPKMFNNTNTTGEGLIDFLKHYDKISKSVESLVINISLHGAYLKGDTPGVMVGEKLNKSIFETMNKSINNDDKLSIRNSLDLLKSQTSDGMILKFKLPKDVYLLTTTPFGSESIDITDISYSLCNRILDDNINNEVVDKVRKNIGLILLAGSIIGDKPNKTPGQGNLFTRLKCSLPNDEVYNIYHTYDENPYLTICLNLQNKFYSFSFSEISSYLNDFRIKSSKSGEDQQIQLLEIIIFFKLILGSNIKLVFLVTSCLPIDIECSRPEVRKIVSSLRKSTIQGQQLVNKLLTEYLQGEKDNTKIKDLKKKLTLPLFNVQRKVYNCSLTRGKAFNMKVSNSSLYQKCPETVIKGLDYSGIGLNAQKNLEQIGNKVIKDINFLANLLLNYSPSGIEEMKMLRQSLNNEQSIKNETVNNETPGNNGGGKKYKKYIKRKSSKKKSSKKKINKKKSIKKKSKKYSKK